MEEVPATKMEVIVYDRKVPLFKDAEITLCGDRITARGEGVDLVFIIFVLFFAVMNIILFRSRIFAKKNKK